MRDTIDYKKMMNGYRDPLTAAAEHKRALEEERAFRALTGGMPSGGSPGSESGERECGYRDEGGVYAEVPKSRYGKPLEHFMTCYPVPIDAGEYRLNPKGMGVTLVDLPEDCLTCGGTGETVARHILVTDVMDVAGLCSECGGLGKVPVTHIFDIVGQDNYPNVADFIEETRRRGVSRRLELSPEGYARLTPRSRLIMLHKRACIFNPQDYYKGIEYGAGGWVTTEGGLLELERMSRAGCPKYHPQHKLERLEGVVAGYLLPQPDRDAASTLNVPGESATPAPLPGCAALWYHDIDKGESIPETEELANYTLKEPGRFVERHLVSGTYRGYSRPAGVTPAYGLGIFAIFPLVKIVVVDPEGRYADKVEKAKRAKVDVSIEDC